MGAPPGPLNGVKTRLLLVFAMSAAVALGVGMVLTGPFVWLLRDLMHLGCWTSSMAGVTSWNCPDGVAYVIPSFGFVALIGAVALIIGVRREFRHDDSTTRIAGAHLLAALGATPLVIQAVVSVPSGIVGYYGVDAIWGGSALFAAGLAVIVARRRTTRTFVAVCALGILASLTAVLGAPLALPFLVVVAAVLGAAIAVRLPDQKALSSLRAGR